MQPPPDEVRDELKPLLRANEKRLGQVYRLLDRGWTDQQIATELGVPSSNFVSNQRNIVRALLEGRLPNGPAMANQARSAVRGLTNNVALSAEATRYIGELISALTAIGPPEPSGKLPTQRVATTRIESKKAPTLRRLVDDEIKRRLDNLEQRLAGLGVDPDDYHAGLTAPFALDVIVRLITGPMSRTTRDLHGQRRLDLSIEQAIVDWARDLPLTTDLVESARGRLDYWRHE